MTRVFVAGEGPHEIGRWAEERERRSTSTRGDGILAELFRRLRPSCTIIDGVRWDKIVKATPGGHAQAEERNLRGAALKAREAGAEVLLWCRDTDHRVEREQSLADGMAHIATLMERWAGGPVVPCIEAWGLALKGAVPNPEALKPTRLKEIAEEHGVHTEAGLSEAARHCALDGTPSPSLGNWLSKARSVVAQLEAEDSA